MTVPSSLPPIRDLVTREEFRACVELQELTWGSAFSERVPSAILGIAARMGGVVAGSVLPDGSLAGFVFGLTGLEDGVPTHWSDMLAEIRSSPSGSPSPSARGATRASHPPPDPRGRRGRRGGGSAWPPRIPGYSYETTDTAWHILTGFLLPGLAGREILGPEEVFRHAPHVRGHPMAKAAVEMAVWDLQAKVVGAPLWELLGASGAPVPVGVSIGLQPDDFALLRRVEEYLEEGYRRIKLKIRPGRDVAMLRAVRDRFPEAPLMADANSAYTLDDLSLLKEIDALELLMIEQPLGHEDLLDHARLQAELRTPICLDESIRSVSDLELALELRVGAS
jgi:hypothetical protein